MLGQKGQNMKKNAFLVLSGPSGSGKSTIVKEVLSLYGPKIMGTTVSYTTRTLRGAEQEGKHYHFVSEKEFLSLKEKNFFAEWAYVYNHYYGTAIKQINQHWSKNRAIIKDFDLQGASAIKRLYPQALRIFISPPSVKELADRVRKRNENNMEEMKFRLEKAQQEMEQNVQFDYHLKNVNLNKTIEKITKIIDEYLKL